MREIEQWDTIDSKSIIDDQWLTLSIQKRKLPDGTVIDPFYLEHRPSFSIVIAWDSEMKLLYEHTYRAGLDKVTTEVPAGMIEEGEEPEHAAQRELLEETGYEAENWIHLFNLACNGAFVDSMACCYMATGIRKVAEQKLDTTEDLTYGWMPYDEVIEKLHTGGFEQAFITAAIYRSLELMNLRLNSI